MYFYYLLKHVCFTIKMLLKQRKGFTSILCRDIIHFSEKIIYVVLRFFFWSLWKLCSKFSPPSTSESVWASTNWLSSDFWHLNSKKIKQIYYVIDQKVQQSDNFYFRVFVFGTSVWSNIDWHFHGQTRTIQTNN